MEPLSAVQGEGPATSGESKIPFEDLLQQSIQNLEQAQQLSQEDSYALALGHADDLAAISIRSAKATAALELTVEAATRAVNAYKEILQMQI